MTHENNVRCRCGHHYIIPTLVALIGVVFLLGNIGFLMQSTVGIVWPSLLTLIGLQLFVSRRCKCYGDHHHCHHCEEDTHSDKTHSAS